MLEPMAWEFPCLATNGVSAVLVWTGDKARHVIKDVDCPCGPVIVPSNPCPCGCGTWAKRLVHRRFP